MNLNRVICGMLLAIGLLLTPASAIAQERFGPPAPGTVAPPVSRTGNSTLPMRLESMNPVSALAEAASVLPGNGKAPSGDQPAERSRGLSTAINIVVILTVLSLVPSIMLMTTCFMRIIIVLGLVKQALGTNQLPPAQVITGLSLVMTLIVMAPTIDRINHDAITPYREGKITSYDILWDKAKQPLRDFMFDQIEQQKNYGTLLMILNYRGIDTSKPELLTRGSADMITLIPTYILSELKTAFLMGFKIYLPFLVIDMVISSLLISMSMMMLPPVLISLPFKLLMFVMVDGWSLIAGGLMHSFVIRNAPVPEVALWFQEISGFV